MPEMFFSSAPAAVADVTQAAIANATGDLVTATYVLAAAGFFVGLLQVHVVWRGINKMTEASEKRDKRHEDAMAAEADRHQEAMDAQKDARAAEADRHREAMDALAAERKDSQRRHEQAMKALNALIRNSGRRTRPVPAR